MSGLVSYRRACEAPDDGYPVMRRDAGWDRDRVSGRMLFAKMRMERVSAVGQARRSLLSRVSTGLVWSGSNVGGVPDFRLDDLRAERQASSHDWRVAPVFEARGPPAFS